MTITRIHPRPAPESRYGCSPYGCSWCGDERHHHGSQWAPIIGLHKWTTPTQAQILARMRARRAERLAANPAIYHITTGWLPEPNGESAVPCCADCMGFCSRWERIRARLSRQRRQLALKTSTPGNWGGEASWPF